MFGFSSVLWKQIFIAKRKIKLAKSEGKTKICCALSPNDTAANSRSKKKTKSFDIFEHYLQVI